MSYETRVDNILAQIVFDLRGTDLFPIENVTYGFYKQWTEDQYPNAHVRFTRDRVGFATKDEEEHTFSFEVVVGILGTGEPEADQDTLIEVISTIYEAIRADNTLDGHANWVLVRDVDVTFRRDRSLIFFECLILLEVKLVW